MTINKRRANNIPIVPSSEMDRTSVYFIPELKHKLKVVSSQLSLECNQIISYSKIVNDIIMEHIDTFIEDYKEKHAEAIRRNIEETNGRCERN